MAFFIFVVLLLTPLKLDLFRFHHFLGSGVYHGHIDLVSLDGCCRTRIILASIAVPRILVQYGL